MDRDFARNISSVYARQGYSKPRFNFCPTRGEWREPCGRYPACYLPVRYKQCPGPSIEKRSCHAR
jgi:hypothetical protein